MLQKVIKEKGGDEMSRASLLLFPRSVPALEVEGR